MAIVEQVAVDEKRVSTLAAMFALAGHELKSNRNADGREIFTVGRWGQARTFSHLHDVEAFLQQVSGGRS